MQGFLDIRFPDDISYGISGGPEYATDVVETFSDYEQRNINWQDARYRFDLKHAVKSKEQLEKLIAFFRCCHGKAYSFRFKDWTDYRAHKQVLGIGDGKRKEFQLIKKYRFAEQESKRVINKPIAASVKLYCDAVEVSGQQYQLNDQYGTIHFTNPPAFNQIIRADFEFDIAVRFDTDIFSASIDEYGCYSWNNISLIEVKVLYDFKNK